METYEHFKEDFKTYPAVYAVTDAYQICVLATCEMMVWVEVGDETFYDESNGILCSSKLLHKVEVPQDLLDAARGYTVCYRKIIERKPYFTETEDVCRVSFAFYPVEGDRVRIYHISDAHNKVETPIRAGLYFGESPDLLVLNGDIPNHSGKIEFFDTIHQIAGEITKGEHPVIFSRGNHDTRGIYAEHIAEYTPTNNGNPYFTFRLGDLWGIVLDCGEDKPDDHPEYGNTICFSNYRKKETRFIERVVKNAAQEYEAEGVRRRVVVCHVPFTRVPNPPFDIEQDTYAYWCKLLREEIKPNVMLCGHTHQVEVHFPGGAYDDLGQPCPIIVGGKPFQKTQKELGIDRFMGAAIEWEQNTVTVHFNDQDHNIKSEHTFEV